MSFFDWFKRDWHNSNPEKRTQAIRDLDASHQDIFTEKATMDPDKNVRLEAIKKLNSLDVLRRMASSDADETVQKRASEKLQEVIFQTLKKFQGEPSETEFALAEEVSKTNYAEDAYKTLTIPKLRLALVQKTTKQSVLTLAALRDLNEEVALAALENLKNEKALADVAENSRHTSVRTKANQKIKAMRAANEVKATPEEVLEQKRSALVKQAEFLSASRTILENEETFEILMKEASLLDMGNKSEYLNTLYNDFKEKVSKAKEQQALEAEKAKELAEKKAFREQLLNEIEHLLNAPKTLETKAKINELLGNAKEESKEAEPRWITRYQNLVYRAEKILKAEEVEIQKPVIKETVLTEEHKEILDKLEALLKAEIDSFTEKKFRTLTEAWHALPKTEAEISETFALFETKFKEKLNAFKEAEKKIFEEKASVLKAIIADVKSIPEDLDFKEISIRLKNNIQKWKETVGEEKFRFHDLWKEFSEAKLRFQKMRDWESWHNEQDKDVLLLELEKLAAETPSEEVLDKAKKIIARFKEIGPVSAQKSQEYSEKYKSFVDTIFKNCASILEAKAEEREENLKKKEELIAKLKALLENTEISSKDRFREVKAIQETWKSIGQVPREKVAENWESFKTLIDTFYSQHKEVLKQEDAKRKENYEKKLALCEQAEALKDSTDFANTTVVIKKLQEEWKTFGPVPRELSDEIWNRFRNACDAFFENRRLHFEAIDAEKQENLKKKKALCEKLEQMNATDATEEALNAVAEEWKAIGLVPKENLESLILRYRKATDNLIALKAKEDPALAERLDVIASRKKEIINKINELSGTAGVSSVSDIVRELQTEWKTLGSSGAKEQELYTEFHNVCDEFFARRRDQLEIQGEARKNNLQKKVMLCEQAERLLSATEETPYHLISQIKQLRRLWKEIGAVPREDSDAVWNRFNTACDTVYNKAKEAMPEKPAETDKTEQG